MTGGLMQLVAYGAQDVYLTGNPQITFFKIVYRRHTDFAIEAIDNVFTGTPDLGKNSTCILTKSGDLISNLYLKTTLTATSGSNCLVKSVTMSNGLVKNKIINSANILGTNSDTPTTQLLTKYLGLSAQYKITLGSGTIPKYVDVGDIISYTNSGETTWFEITAILSETIFHITNDETTDFSSFDTNDFAIKFYKNDEVGYVKDIGYALMEYVDLQIGGTSIDKKYGLWMTVWDELTVNSGKRKNLDKIIGNSDNAVNSDGTLELIIPLHLFCCNNYGLALPIISLYYHDVTLEFQFESAQASLRSDNSDFTIAMSTTSVTVDYIYLNTEERKRFAQAAHEYLIEQVQYAGRDDLVESVKNKYKLYFNHPCKELIWVTKTPYNQHANFTDLTSTAVLLLNGENRFEERTGRYFNGVQPYQHHSQSPKPGIYVYSFAINPEFHQPSGSCNFSRVDSIELDVTSTAGQAATNYIHIFTKNYNILRIMSGMGGIAFSN